MRAAIFVAQDKRRDEGSDFCDQTKLQMNAIERKSYITQEPKSQRFFTRERQRAKELFYTIEFYFYNKGNLIMKTEGKRKRSKTSGTTQSNFIFTTKATG